MNSKAEALKVLLMDDSGYFNIFHEVTEQLIVDALKEQIKDVSKQDHDIHETQDNKSHLLSSLYRVLEYYTTVDEYKKFVKEMQSETSN
jgi:hypothetical protein